MCGISLGRTGWSAGGAIALLMTVGGSAAAGEWSPTPESPKMIGIYVGQQSVTGQTLVVAEGQTLKLKGKSRDVDTLTEGTNKTTSKDDADVIWTATGGGSVNNPPRKPSDSEATITPPDVPEDLHYITFTVTAQADDNRTVDDPPGSLSPHTGNRNDAYGTSQTVTIKVIKLCPGTVSAGSTCSDPADWTAYWNAYPLVRTYGFRADRMSVSGGVPPPPDNWNGLVVTAELALHPTDPGTATDADFENITRQEICQGSAQFVVGMAAPTVGDCLMPAADNAFWDFCQTGPRLVTLFKEGLPTKTVNCRQVFKCKDNNLTPAFKLTKSFSNVTVGGVRRNQVPCTRTTD